MSNRADLLHFPPAVGDGASASCSRKPPPMMSADPSIPLRNLASLQTRIDSVRKLLSDSVNTRTVIGKPQIDFVSGEISSAVHQIIVNGAALIACSQTPVVPTPPSAQFPSQTPSTSSAINPPDFTQKSPDSNNLEFDDRPCKIEMIEDSSSDDWETIELGSEELLAEHVHFCDVCGKGFKRDANLRMHMRAHGNQFKTPEALAKPEKCVEMGPRKKRFSCPLVGCNRNKSHKRFKPLKSVVCVKNHFKRSHCPKMYSCNRCNKKSFSVMADLRSHLKHCGETKWKCSCGTSFSRKDKLFGHMALFEGHMPAIMEEDEKEKGMAMAVGDEEDEDLVMEDKEFGPNFTNNGSLDGLIKDYGSLEDFCFDDFLNSPATSGWGNEVDGFFDF